MTETSSAASAREEDRADQRHWRRTTSQLRTSCRKGIRETGHIRTALSTAACGASMEPVPS
jgi:hypothetical protein